MHWKQALSAVPAILFAAFLLWHEWSLLPDGRTHLYFLDVGQGDSALVVTPSGKTVMIDGGPDLSALGGIGAHLPFFHRRIDMLVLSHPHLDHLASFPEILKRYNVGAVVLSGLPAGLPRYRKMLMLMRTLGVGTVSPTSTGHIDFGDGAHMDILWPSAAMLAQHPDDFNNTSVVVRISDGSGSALFTGDISEDAEKRMMAAGIRLRSTILKVPHHGSNGSSSTGFILAVAPSLAVISVGEGNVYHHPRPEIVRRYQELGIPVRRADTDGETDIVWDTKRVLGQAVAEKGFP